jgi:superfamily II RNA helicase
MFSFDRTDCEILAQDLLNALESAEDVWRESSTEWNEKLRVWENWKLRAKERERLLERAEKQKKDLNTPVGQGTPESSWEHSFDPDDPSPQFSFAGSYRDTSYSKGELDEDLNQLRWVSIPPWAITCLRRGIAVHHAGMHRHYRSLVER